MEPKAGGGGGSIVPYGSEALAEEVVGKFTGLGQSIDTFAAVKVQPTITCIVDEVILGYKLVGGVLEVNSGILGAIKLCAQVIVLYFKAHKMCAFAGEDAIN